MTNPADSPNAGFNLSSRQSRKRPLTDCDGISLRKEVRDLDHHNFDQNRSISWNGTINRYRDYIRDKRGIETVFENQSTGELATGSSPHRFATDYSAKQYAKLKDLERGVQDRYGKRLHTAMLTLTASSTPNGEPLPPVDHLDELLSSWSSVSRTLRRVLDDTRSARLAILEPHPGDGQNNGYLHIHIAVFIDGYVKPETLQPVIDAHVRNCDAATAKAHDLDDDDDPAIRVRHAGADRDPGYNHALAEGIDYDSDTISELAIYLAEYLGTYGDDDPLNEPEHVQAANALLWATNRQRWRPCSTAQSLMAYDGPDNATDWEVVGIEDDGEFIPADPENGGIDTFVTGPAGPPDPPPTDH
jgi:hypothetical protein